MRKMLIEEACIINEGEKQISDLLVVGERIDKIDRNISSKDADAISANGSYLIPGMIDDQVHFREPELTYKGDLHSESCAAVAGGITSFMEMSNTKPTTLSQELLEEKYAMAAKKSLANFSFFMGVTKNNLEEVLKTDTESVCGISDDGLYIDNEESLLANDPEFLEKGYFANLIMFDLYSPWKVTPETLLYKCKWSPFENYRFRSKIINTFVNGILFIIMELSMPPLQECD